MTVYKMAKIYKGTGERRLCALENDLYYVTLAKLCIDA